MGQEIAGEQFEPHDFARFAQRLREETERLRTCYAAGGLSDLHGWGGYELEAWLVDRAGQPAPVNDLFLAAMHDEAVSPELARFNIELNSPPLRLYGDALARMLAGLERDWHRCRAVARTIGAELLMIGILPTVRDDQLNLANMSRLRRYHALNEQVLRQRRGRPIRLDIEGTEHLRTEHCDVMLEAATTSFQVHLQVRPDEAVRFYNAAQVAAAPMVAVSTNSPLLFGRRLWLETRIPLFEQAVPVGGIDGAVFGPLKRVTFGSGYARCSLLEPFQENLEHYPVLLPVSLDEPAERLPHLRLHNGTIWRWNRPLVGFDADGVPHLRIEHRVVAAGPSPLDSIANAAFFFGLIDSLARQDDPVEHRLDFAAARDNFYAAARHGLAARVHWLDGRSGRMDQLLCDRLLPAARAGLGHLGCDPADIDRFLGIVEARVRHGRTGAHWQLAWLDAHPQADLAALVQSYRQGQESGSPVHEWPI